MYKRIVLKLSGEALVVASQGFGIENEACRLVAFQIKEALALGVEIAIVIGGGNIFRGAQKGVFDFDPIVADHIGMAATAINGLVLAESLKNMGCHARVMGALNVSPLVEKYDSFSAIDSLKRGSVVIFVGGIGHPYFTTDTAGALRAIEIEADLFLKGTKVDGVYDADPKKSAKAVRYQTLTYTDVLVKQLGIMDSTAIAMCRAHRKPIFVFDFFKEGALVQALTSSFQHGTLISGD